ncbi:TIR domain-containing protein [Photobacterium alginatilyticum]|uniref:TIR domain-containing protein n=1 Tax=Photobacterium alginatilyticum TaxID=1775171 RepID=UPI004067DCBC
MIKCFLSHSSKDKESFVRIVKNEIKKEATIYDEDTFEKGMKPIDEIMSGLEDSSLFVIFLSEASLSSEWVEIELNKAKELLDDNIIQRIYPIIIDKNITYEDKRIPEWMQKDLNVQHIQQPKVAARKINQRLREIAITNHPKIHERESIFVGRNEKIDEVEQRFDDFEMSTPVTIIASGLPSIGRKSFIKQSLKKTNIIKGTYEFPVISLYDTDSIEDFILRLSDLGLTEHYNLTDLISLSLDDKIALASNIISNIANERERVLIEDSGAIIKFDSDIVSWFVDITDRIRNLDFLTICIASRFRANRKFMHKNDSIYITEIAELEIKERNGLFTRYSRYKGLNLEREDVKFFTSLLCGYPQQVFYAVNLISDSSVFDAKKQSHIIREYSEGKAKIILESLKDKKDELDFLHLMSKFDFISYKMLFELLDEDKYYPILLDFINSSICERLGSNGDYVRVNEVIKDYVSRNRFGIKLEFQELLQNHVKEFVSQQSDIASGSDGDRDISDHMFSIQEALMLGYEVDDSLLIPSYFMRSIRNLYLERKYKDAINLSDRVIQRSEFIDETILTSVRYTKCQCLARQKNHDFFAEVRKIPEPDRSFLHGFYFRLSGQQDKAITSFKQVLDRRPNDQRAKAELVLIYMQNDQPDLAFSLAKDNYNKSKNNPINANNYFACLLHKQPRKDEYKNELNDIIKKLRLDPSNRTQEMSYSNEAKLKAYYENNETEAFSIIDDVILNYSNVSYPLLTKADIAIHFNNKDKLKEAVDSLQKMLEVYDQSYKTYIRFKAILVSMSGDKKSAEEIVRNELKGVNTNSLARLYEKINSY